MLVLNSHPRLAFSYLKHQVGPRYQARKMASSTPLPTSRAVPRSRRRETIEDSGEDEQDVATLGPRTRRVDAISDDDSNHSTPPESANEIDTAFEALFGPTSTDRRKRRRISLDAEPAMAQRGRRNIDAILTSPPEARSQTADPPSSPIPFRTPKQTAQPAASRIPSSVAQRAPGPATPASTRPSRNHLRFMMSQPTFSSQSQFTPKVPAASANQLPTPAPQRQKPAFVLPRSPSPSRTQEATADIPSPFSPSSRALRRRGRARSSAPSYLPGGMASDVRSWILEIGTKREQTQLGAVRRVELSQRDPLSEIQKYYAVVRISGVRQSALSSSGPLAFIQGSSVPSDDGGDTTNSETQKLLLLGPPRSATVGSNLPTPELQPGQVIGVYRGLVWEVGLDREHLASVTPSMEELRLEHESGLGDSEGEEKWLVGMEWELICDC
ncbi:uncharacterized protein ACLA_092850 [Aspergillus clavatus NRRL 1]|uniref:Uncharacterized protein n=1 Tax=Aspergillus clavatus (strain ATCC 1007 / CBS 513.65 / DSM 816 / NCTC 3887 / NRRL 1 / QM 1276 / 107) TaxID=344612 RepID=A1CFD8_ASPCL|nr:uncharacterized protein ACLA_092850 [Aspergillus clavatus NRRL 1]EAW11587.1 conserved hypothetical protein [Aspergillus clavatus NRRL 1]